jgi:hypothetical protein
MKTFSNLPSIPPVRDNFVSQHEVDEIIKYLYGNGNQFILQRLVDDEQVQWENDSPFLIYIDFHGHLYKEHSEKIALPKSLQGQLDLLYEIRRRIRRKIEFPDQDVRGKDINLSADPISLPLLDRDKKCGVTQEMADEFIQYAFADKELLQLASDAMQRRMDFFVYHHIYARLYKTVEQLTQNNSAVTPSKTFYQLREHFLLTVAVMSKVPIWIQHKEKFYSK